MSSERRIEKLNNLLREELSKILESEFDFSEGSLVTITRVLISPDVHYATVFISMMGADVKEILEILRKNVYNVQQMLNRKVRMRPVPKISFEVDEAEIRRETIEKSLADLKKNQEI